MKKIIISAPVAFFLFYLTKPKLKHFKESEFGWYYPFMSNELLKKLDLFREHWGYPVEVSSAVGALGRIDSSDSQHNMVKNLGIIKAVDFFPKVPDGIGGWRYIQTREERERAYMVALAVGFSGIGIYTDTIRGNMLHGDIRTADKVATWARVAGAYTSITEVL